MTGTLSEEDTEEDAEKRATTTSGTSNTAYRTGRVATFYFGFTRVHYKARFKVECPGTYDIHLKFSTKPHGSPGPVKYETMVKRQHLQSGEQTVEDDIKVLKTGIDYTLEGVTLEAPCPDEQCGRGYIRLGSVNVGLSLGRGAAGANAGYVRLDAAAITSAIYETSALVPIVAENGGTEVIRDSSGDLRQMKAPQTLADIETLVDGSSYKVSFYANEDVGAQNSTTKVYAFSGTPYVVYTFENPDSSGATRLKITETRGSLDRVSEYAYNSGTGTWSLTTGDGLRKESLAVSTSGSDTTKTTTIRESNDTVVTKTIKTYHTYAWGEELISEVLDPDGAALTTTYTFYDNSGTDGTNYSQLKQRANPDGSWERHTYDSAKRTLKTIRPYLDAAPNTTNESLCRVTEYTYGTLSDADSDSQTEQITTIVEKTLGTETGRSYTVEWSKAVTLGGESFTHRWDIRCATSGAAWNAGDNLITKTLVYTADPFIGQTRRVINPDGTIVLTSHVIDSGDQTTTTVKSGAPNGTSDDIVSGTVTTTNTSAYGQLTGGSVLDVESDLMLDVWTATELDELGRPIQLDHADGTFESRTYACCGLASSRDRAGTVTAYQYDVLGRQTHVTGNEVTFRTAYDADGRVKSVTRLPEGGDSSTEMVQSSSTYDLAGRLTQNRDAGNRLTTYSESYNSSTGETTRTTTNPDEGTVVEISARDGSRLSSSGTATAPRAYEYGLDSGELFTKEILVGPSGATTEWSKTFTDFAGRAYKTVLADGATTQSYYNTVGQLIRQVDPDSIKTLFAYNSRGEQEVVAISLNGDNVIDYNGTDRITKTANTVAEKTVDAATFVVQRSTTRVWETDSTDSSTAVSISEQTPNGLRSWQTVRGLTTSSVTVIDDDDARTVTTTASDGVKTVQVYTHGRLDSTTVKTPADAQIAKVEYGYDAQGRLHTQTDARNGATTYTYLADDQIDSVVTPDPDGSGTTYTAQTTSYHYDAAGRPDRVTHPDATVTYTAYGPTGAVKRTWGSRTYPAEYTYDPQGRVKTLGTWQAVADLGADPWTGTGHAVTTWNYDAARGWLTSKRYADNTGPDYTYTDAGRLETRTWERGIVCTYDYNAAGDLESENYSDATPDVAYTYDRTGRMSAIEDASGTRTLAYHASGQLDSETYTAGALTGLSIDRTFDSQSRLGSVSALSASSALNQVGYSYDAASRLETVTHNTHTATYAYATNSSLIDSVTFKQGGSTTRLTTTKTYDKLNRLTSISSVPSAASALSAAYVYNTANQRTKATREDSTYWDYGYDALGQVTSGKKRLANNTVINGLDFAWTYDDIGNRKTAVTNGQTATYTANALNQYEDRTVPGVVDVFGAAAIGTTVTVRVDDGTPQATTRHGELYAKQLTVTNASAAQNPTLTITGVKNNVGSGGEDAVTEITQSAFVAQTPETFTHDADGNLTADARWTYTWDAENRLIAMETATAAVTAGVTKQKLEFAYDAQGRRFSKKVYAWNSGSSLWTLSSELRFLYDGWNLLVELRWNSSTSTYDLNSSYAWGSDLSGSAQGAGGVGGLLFASTSTSTHASAFDGNGNIIGYVDMSTGANLAIFEYNAFGETVVINGNSGVFSPFRFSTKYADAETDLLYYGFRYYSTHTGRWVASDPLHEAGGLNLHGFVSNNPLSFADPFGLNLYAIDGTGNDESTQTNVLKFFGRYRDGARYYYRGPGNPSDGIPILGQPWGAGSDGIAEAVVQQICIDLAKNPRTPIDIVGFSRGAAIANEVVTLLSKKACCKKTGGAVQVRFLGLFDTVHAFPLIVSWTWNDKTIPANVQSAAHALARDEDRTAFRPSLLQPASGTQYAQQWFPGVHSDVGGSNDRNAFIGVIALKWMLGQAQRAGVKMDGQGMPSQSAIDQWMTRPAIVKPFENSGASNLLRDR